MSVDLFNSDFLLPLLQATSRKNKSIILLGDFNTNLLNYDNPGVYTFSEHVNLSFSAGKFPSSLKVSKVIPVFARYKPAQNIRNARG